MHEVYLLVLGLLVGDVLYYFRAGRRVEAWLCRLANRRTLAILLCAGASMVPRVAVMGWLPPPEPLVPDEFSYLLGAQTLAMGRIANPVHPFWQHFESPHINSVPSYQSMYQPAPTLFLTVGKVLFGNPWWGVWLSCGMMCAAFCWALQPIIRPKYAMLAGLYAAVKYGMNTNYSDSYWGGAVSAMGAAITVGALARLMQTRRPAYVPLLVLGVGLLANSRPYEGFLFAAPVALILLVWIYRSKTYMRVLAPALALVGILVGGMVYYNYRSTGIPTEMPYVANYQQYHFVRPFVGMGMAPLPKYRHYQMAKLIETWEGEPGQLAQTTQGLEFLTAHKYDYYYRGHFAPLMILALIGLGYALWRRKYLILASTFAVVFVGLFAVVWWPLMSYPAPLLVSFAGLALLGLRVLRTASIKGHHQGYYWARGLLLVLLFSSLLNYRENFQFGKRLRWSYPASWSVERERIIHDLENRGGQHLLLVKYSHSHIPYQEWVYNGPDIDHQRVIFARSMGNSEDCRLMSYYSRRNIWLLYPDEGPWPQLIPINPDTADCRDEKYDRTPFSLLALVKSQDEETPIRSDHRSRTGGADRRLRTADPN